MSGLDLSQIPVPSPEPNTSADSVNPFWAKAQEQLARIQPVGPALPTALPAHLQDPLYAHQFLAQQTPPPRYQAPPPRFSGPRPMNGRPRDGGYQAGFTRPPFNTANKYPNFRHASTPANENNFQPQPPKMPFGGIRFGFNSQNRGAAIPPPVTVMSAQGQAYVFSEFFSRMVPQSVKTYCDRALAAAPDQVDQVRYYLKERIVPMLDSGMANRINWEAERLPHQTNFQLNMQWTPASKFQIPGSCPPTSAHNGGETSTRKRPPETDKPMNYTPIKTSADITKKFKEDDSKAKKSKKERKAEKKQQKLQNQFQSKSEDDQRKKAARAERFAQPTAHSANIKVRDGTARSAQPQMMVRRAGQRFNINSFVEKVSLKRRRRIVGTSTQIEKPYFRLTTEADPAMVRPYHILRKSLEHVLRVYREKNNDYHYANDQLKSIRQDIMTQDIQNEFAIQVYEEHALLAIRHKDREEFNQSQNQLKVLYEKVPKSPMRWRFTAYRLVYYAYVESESDATDLMRTHRAAFESRKEMRHAREIYMAYATRNRTRLFRLYEQSEPVLRQLMDFFMERERNRSMQSIISAYRPTLTLRALGDLLLLKRADLLEYLKTLKMEVDESGEQAQVDLRRYANLCIPNA